MTVLKIHQVPNSSYSPPSFEHKPEGFNTRWWHEYHIDMEWFSFWQGELEVAHAGTVSPYTLSDNYENIIPPCEGVEIAFFEVHKDYRGRGIGRSSLELIKRKYPNTRLFAFSKNADNFWSGVGWIYHPRQDDHIGHYWRLYIYNGY